MQMLIALLTIVGVAAGAASASADPIGYYVGVDGRIAGFDVPAAEGGGTYPDNPNAGRLSLLFHHGDHFHALGTYAYAGPAAAPVLHDTNANNRTPETFSGLPPVQLLPGSDDFAGTFRSGLASGLPQNLEYGNHETRNVHSLAGVDDVTYTSSGGRWASTFDEAGIFLELLSATPGLNIAFGGLPTEDLLPGARWRLGWGHELFSVLPTFWVEQGLPFGTFSAEFRLVDGTGRYGDSGRFFVDVATVPEPSLLVLSALGAVAFTRARLRRRPVPSVGDV